MRCKAEDRAVVRRLVGWSAAFFVVLTAGCGDLHQTFALADHVEIPVDSSRTVAVLDNDVPAGDLQLAEVTAQDPAIVSASIVDNMIRVQAEAPGTTSILYRAEGSAGQDWSYLSVEAIANSPTPTPTPTAPAPPTPTPTGTATPIATPTAVAPTPTATAAPERPTPSTVPTRPPTPTSTAVPIVATTTATPVPTVTVLPAVGDFVVGGALTGDVTVASIQASNVGQVDLGPITWRLSRNDVQLMVNQNNCLDGLAVGDRCPVFAEVFIPTTYTAAVQTLGFTGRSGELERSGSLNFAYPLPTSSAFRVEAKQGEGLWVYEIENVGFYDATITYSRRDYYNGSVVVSTCKVPSGGSCRVTRSGAQCPGFIEAVVDGYGPSFTLAEVSCPAYNP